MWWDRSWRPGPMNYTGRDSVLTALAATNPNPLAWEERVQVIRPAATEDADPRIFEVNFRKMIIYGDTSKDVLLQEGDIVYVPPTILASIGMVLEESLRLWPGPSTAGTLVNNPPGSTGSYQGYSRRVAATGAVDRRRSSRASQGPQGTTRDRKACAETDSPGEHHLVCGVRRLYPGAHPPPSRLQMVAYLLVVRPFRHRPALLLISVYLFALVRDMSNLSKSRWSTRSPAPSITWAFMWRRRCSVAWREFSE